MILEAVELGGGIFDGGDGALVAAGDDVEAIGERDGLVAVAHPNDLSFTNFRGGEERGRFVDADFHAAVLLLVSDADFAAEALDEELETVADAEDNDAMGAGPGEEAVGEGGGVGGVDGVGTAGENDDGGVEVGDGGEGGGAGDAERKDGETTDAARDKVRVLGTVIEDENEVGFHVFRVHFWDSDGGCSKPSSIFQNPS